MKVKAPANAPDWASDLARNTQQVIDQSIWPFISRTAILVAELPPAGTANAWMKYYVSNGTGNRREVTSNGVDWRYPDGTAA